MSHDTVYDPKDPNKVYLRPNPGARPVKYEQNIAMQGLMLDRKHSIAMYTSRAGAIAGPQGEPGVTPNVWDTIIASASDEWTAIAVDLVVLKTTFRAPYPLDMTNGYVRASLTQECTGAGDMIIDVTMNGTSMFSTPIHIEAGSRTSVGAAIQSVVNIPLIGGIMLIPDDAEFRVFVQQTGSSFPGSGLKIAVSGIKVAI